MIGPYIRLSNGNYCWNNHTSPHQYFKRSPINLANLMIRQNLLTSCLFWSLGSRDYLCRNDPIPAGSAAGFVSTMDFSARIHWYSLFAGGRIHPPACTGPWDGTPRLQSTGVTQLRGRGRNENTTHYDKNA